MIEPDTKRLIRNIDIAYWQLLDARRALPVEDIFHEEGILSLGGKLLCGIHDIGVFLQERRAANQNRLTRHLSTNWCCWEEADGSIRASSYVTVYSGIGNPPFDMVMPSSINDISDHFERDKTGWRLKRREIDTLFIGQDAPAFLRKSAS